jgi:hypothetical protein
MTRDHTIMDETFNRRDYDPNDPGDFIRNSVFVIMAFTGNDMQESYSSIKDECHKLHLNAQRADENVGSGLVIGEITDQIEKAEFIICDLSHERPNVYYELGYAHGVGNESKDILLIAKEGTILHFDIAPFRVQYYRSTEHLRTILNTNLQGMIKATRRI